MGQIVPQATATPNQRPALAYLQAYFFVDQCDNTWNKVFTMLGVLAAE